MQHQTVPQTEATEPRHDWHFTFGGGQRFDGRFVTIHGTDDDARAEMFRRFGNGWCAQYDATRPTEVTKFPAGLTELPRAEWPDPARPTILNFGVFGIPDAHLDTPATATDIFERIRDELASAGYDLDVLTLMFGKGGQVVDVADSDGFIIGTVSISQPAPAADGTAVARLIAAAGQVIAAGHLTWDSGVDVDAEQGAAHSRLVAAYEVVTGRPAYAAPTVRERLAAELHRIAADLVRLDLAVGKFSSLRLGVVASADLAPWADYLGAATTIDAQNGIPFVETEIKLDGRHSELTIGVQSPKEESEAEQLRARVAELEAQLAAGGAQ